MEKRIKKVKPEGFEVLGSLRGVDADGNQYFRGVRDKNNNGGDTKNPDEEKHTRKLMMTII